MTKRLYLEDSYLKECTAKVTSIDGSKVELDQTIFYAQGGGQPSDMGAITRTKDNAVFRVLSVKNESGKIMHEL